MSRSAYRDPWSYGAALAPEPNPERSCARCHTPRPLAELLAVTPRRAPWRRRYVCRPEVTGTGACFRYGTLSADVERITLATEPGPFDPPESSGQAA